jgi:hypothetical protein
MAAAVSCTLPRCEPVTPSGPVRNSSRSRHSDFGLTRLGLGADLLFTVMIRWLEHSSNAVLNTRRATAGCIRRLSTGHRVDTGSPRSPAKRWGVTVHTGNSVAHQHDRRSSTGLPIPAVAPGNIRMRYRPAGPPKALRGPHRPTRHPDTAGHRDHHHPGLMDHPGESFRSTALTLLADRP